MLTRLEVNGFKNLRNIAVDFGPFTCIAGPNAAGKSNVFDAIQFLAELADRPLMEAAESVRGTRSERSADPRDLFWDPGPGERVMKLGAEMIVPNEIEDDFGQQSKPTMTFLRYELGIGYQPPSGPERIGRLVLLLEELTHRARRSSTCGFLTPQPNSDARSCWGTAARPRTSRRTVAVIIP